jgi:hypothetical protein
MPEPRPELRAVREEPVPPSEAPPEQRAGRRWLVPLLLVVAIGAGLAYVREQELARRLEAQVAGLETELDEARREILAHEARMELVRGHVDDLAGRVEQLQRAVAEGPGAD